MILGCPVTVKRDPVNSTVEGGVIGMHVVLQHCVKLCKRCDGIHVKGIKPALFERPKMAFYLAFAGPVTDAGMQNRIPRDTQIMESCSLE